MYVFAKVPDIAKYVYVNANTGEILRERSLEHSCNSTTVETTFNGAQLMYTDFRDETCTYGTDGFDYYSVNDCNAGSEIRSNYRNDDGDDDLVCDSDNDWAVGGWGIAGVVQAGVRDCQDCGDAAHGGSLSPKIAKVIFLLFSERTSYLRECSQACKPPPFITRKRRITGNLWIPTSPL